MPLTGGMPNATADPVGLRGRVLARRRVHRLHAGPRRQRAVEALPRRHALAHLDLQRQDSRSRRRFRSRRTAATTSIPNWVGDTLYFRSDRAGEYNVFSYDTESKEMKQVTQFTDFPVLDINTDGKQLIFEQAGYLHLLTPGESQPLRLKVGVAIDGGESRARFAKGSKYVRDVSVSPSGSRAAVEFRGEIVTVPAEKGDARNLTNTTGVHERKPRVVAGRQDHRVLLGRGRRIPTGARPAERARARRGRSSSPATGSTSTRSGRATRRRSSIATTRRRIYWMDVASGKITQHRRAEERPRPRAEGCRVGRRIRSG